MPTTLHYVYYDWTQRSHVAWNALSFQVVPGYAYTFSLRISWVKPGGQAMAAAYYWFDQSGDLRCGGTNNCSPLSLKPTGLVAPNYGPQWYRLSFFIISMVTARRGPLRSSPTRPVRSWFGGRDSASSSCVWGHSACGVGDRF